MLEAALKPHTDWPVNQRIAELRTALAKVEAVLSVSLLSPLEAIALHRRPKGNEEGGGGGGNAAASAAASQRTSDSGTSSSHVAGGGGAASATSRTASPGNFAAAPGTHPAAASGNGKATRPPTPSRAAAAQEGKAGDEPPPKPPLRAEQSAGEASDKSDASAAAIECAEASGPLSRVASSSQPPDSSAASDDGCTSGDAADAPADKGEQLCDGLQSLAPDLDALPAELQPGAVAVWELAQRAWVVLKQDQQEVLRLQEDRAAAALERKAQLQREKDERQRAEAARVEAVRADRDKAASERRAKQAEKRQRIKLEIKTAAQAAQLEARAMHTGMPSAAHPQAQARHIGPPLPPPPPPLTARTTQAAAAHDGTGKRNNGSAHAHVRGHGPPNPQPLPSHAQVASSAAPQYTVAQPPAFPQHCRTTSLDILGEATSKLSREVLEMLEMDGGAAAYLAPADAHATPAGQAASTGAAAAAAAAPPTDAANGRNGRGTSENGHLLASMRTPDAVSHSGGILLTSETLTNKKDGGPDAGDPVMMPAATAPSSSRPISPWAAAGPGNAALQQQLHHRDHPAVQARPVNQPIGIAWPPPRSMWRGDGPAPVASTADFAVSVVNSAAAAAMAAEMGIGSMAPQPTLCAAYFQTCHCPMGEACPYVHMAPGHGPQAQLHRRRPPPASHAAGPDSSPLHLDASGPIPPPTAMPGGSHLAAVGGFAFGAPGCRAFSRGDAQHQQGLNPGRGDARMDHRAPSTGRRYAEPTLQALPEDLTFSSRASQAPSAAALPPPQQQGELDAAGRPLFSAQPGGGQPDAEGQQQQQQPGLPSAGALRSGWFGSIW